MYISNTTQEERRIIDCAVDGVYDKVRRAHSLLSHLWDDYFGARDQKEISSYDAEHLGDMIYLIDDLIWSAGLEYALVIGDPDFPGVEQHLLGAEIARKAQEIEKLDSEASSLAQSLKQPELREAIHEKRREIAQLSDDEAAPRLRELLKRKGGLKNES